ncbi:hypothetical protein M514_09914 [Trichuris suis]|uniref:Peptidase aspartic putative domain-containing protein n=1 Tax=Trichuris suis TaxID=68888 RepID=A0A085N4D3_9BILA|nr:hypothetical protein M514_09914 [Trichuris suis]
MMIWSFGCVRRKPSLSKIWNENLSAQFSRGAKEVDILIGADYYYDFVGNEVRRNAADEPVGVQSVFGWLLCGKTGRTTREFELCLCAKLQRKNHARRIDSGRYYELDKVKGALLNEAWLGPIGSLDGHFEEFVDGSCDNFALFTCVLQEYSNRNDAPCGVPSSYDQAERSKLMDLMIASSACDDAAMPPDRRNGAAKSLRQTVVKAVLRRCNYEVNEILRTFIADSNMF